MIFKLSCAFCQITQKDAPAADLRRHDRGVVSFIPLNPVTEGHRLFVPVSHIEREHRDFSLYAGLVAEYAAAHGGRLGCDFNLILNIGPDASQTIPHLHWHVVPRRPGDGLVLPWTGQQK